MFEFTTFMLEIYIWAAYFYYVKKNCKIDLNLNIFKFLWGIPKYYKIVFY